MFESFFKRVQSNCTYVRLLLQGQTNKLRLLFWKTVLQGTRGSAVAAHPADAVDCIGSGAKRFERQTTIKTFFLLNYNK